MEARITKINDEEIQGTRKFIIYAVKLVKVQQIGEHLCLVFRYGLRKCLSLPNGTEIFSHKLIILRYFEYFQNVVYNVSKFSPKNIMLEQ